MKDFQIANANEWPEPALSKYSLDQSTHLVTLTHDPKIDDPALIYNLKKI